MEETKQVSMRLPIWLLDEIEQRSGKGKVEKLVNYINELKGLNPQDPICKMEEFEKRLSKLESELQRNPPNPNTPKRTQKTTSTGGNAAKQAAANQRIIDAVNGLTDEQKQEALAYRYPISKVREFTGLTKGITDGKTDIILNELNR